MFFVFVLSASQQETNTAPKQTLTDIDDLFSTSSTTNNTNNNKINSNVDLLTDLDFTTPTIKPTPIGGGGVTQFGGAGLPSSMTMPNIFQQQQVPTAINTSFAPPQMMFNQNPVMIPHSSSMQQFNQGVMRPQTPQTASNDPFANLAQLGKQSATPTTTQQSKPSQQSTNKVSLIKLIFINFHFFLNNYLNRITYGLNLVHQLI